MRSYQVKITDRRTGEPVPGVKLQTIWSNAANEMQRRWERAGFQAVIVNSEVM